MFKARRGLNEQIVCEISEMKREPAWMRDFRLKSLKIFESKPMPRWGGNIGIDFQDIYYYLKPTDGQGKTWDDVPAEIKETFDKLGIPEAEKKFLAGVKAQFESEVVYGSLQEDLAKKGVIFTDTDTAVREHGDLVREYIGSIIPPEDNKFAALNSAVWSGGSFIYVPKGVKIEFPLQAYFRINAERMGQFERTLILVDEGAEVHYVEGCTAPDVFQRKPALGGGRDHRPPRRPLPLHDDPELGQQHLQPGHQAGRRLRRLAHGMDRRQPGQPADDEVPGRVHDGAGRSRRDPFDRVRLEGPAPGRRRESRALRSAHQEPHHLQEHQQERRPLELPRPVQGAGRRGRLEEQRRVRRVDSRSARAAATRIRTSKSKSRTCKSSTRPASRASARSSSSTCKAAASPRPKPAR